MEKRNIYLVSARLLDLGLGGVLIVAALAKLIDLEDFVLHLRDVPVLGGSPAVALLAGLGLVSMELCFGFLLAQGTVTRRLRVGVVSLFGAFLGWQILYVSGMLGTMVQPCKCLGDIDSGLAENSVYLIGRNSLLLALALLALWINRPTGDSSKRAGVMV